jgi:hypothetical protein
MSSLRQKAITQNLGSEPPSWTRSGLGRADRQPFELLRGLGADRFQGKGDDWVQDIFELLRISINSSYLRGLYYDPVPYRSRGGIALRASPDLYSYSGAVMLRMIKSILWAAEQQGKIAMPTRLKVVATSDNMGVWISAQ